MNKYIYIIGTIIIVVLIIVINKSANTNKNSEIKTQVEETVTNNVESEVMDTNNIEIPVPFILEENKRYSAVITTSEGKITIELNTDQTPITTNNFVYLAQKGFYDGTIFHRVIKDFMIQGGDPKGNGTGGPGYMFDDEPITKEYTRGTVAMANSGPNTNGSQFFIMHESVPIQKLYVIFGMVTEGIEVVDKIATAEVKINPNNPTEKSQPVNPVTIENIEIITAEF